MVARLKLKGIDGRAPPGVNKALPHCTAPKSDSKELVGWPSSSGKNEIASLGKGLYRSLLGQHRQIAGNS